MSATPTRARVAPVAPVRRAGRACPSPRRARPARASSDARGTVANTLPRRAALALSGASSLATGAAALGASAGASPPPSPASSPAFARSGAAIHRVVFEDARVAIPGSGQSVPVATWFPDSASGAPDPLRRDEMSSPGVLYYPHAISVAKIARVLLNTPESTPRWLDRSTPLLAAPGVRVAARGETGRLTNSFDKVAVLCHGYLGSRFDLVDLAEALANEGFLVIAPEFAESLASPSTTPAYARPGAPPPKNPSATRDEVVDAALRAFAPGFFSPAPSQSIDSSTSETGSVRVPRVVIAGQSAGASTATSARGPFAARVAIAGFRPPEALEAREALLRDPLLVVASAGDGVISLYPRESGAFGAYEGIAASVEKMPSRVPKYDIGAFAARVGEIRAARSSADEQSAFSETLKRNGALNAFVTYEPPGGDGGATTGLPTHISFLSSRTNDAMVEVLSPLLPVARAVGVPVLDFDKYQIARDSDAVNARLVPLIAEWLNAAVE
jgi:dienelactone hydrolase